MAKVQKVVQTRYILEEELANKEFQPQDEERQQQSQRGFVIRSTPEAEAHVWGRHTTEK